MNIYQNIVSFLNEYEVYHIWNLEYTVSISIMNRKYTVSDIMIISTQLYKHQIVRNTGLCTHWYKSCAVFSKHFFAQKYIFFLQYYTLLFWRWYVIHKEAHKWLRYGSFHKVGTQSVTLGLKFQIPLKLLVAYILVTLTILFFIKKSFLPDHKTNSFLESQKCKAILTHHRCNRGHHVPTCGN